MTGTEKLLLFQYNRIKIFWIGILWIDCSYLLVDSILMRQNFRQITDYAYHPYSRSSQSHYREVTRLEIFTEQELIFGLDLGRLAILKKGSGPIMSNFWGCFFIFSGAKKSFKPFKNILAFFIKKKIKKTSKKF